MLRDVLDGSSGGGRRAMRLLAAMAALFCAVVLSAMFMPTRAEARYLNVKFVIDNIDEHPDKKDEVFHYICSFYKWNDYATGGWRISKNSTDWDWEELDSKWVAGPNDRNGKYWNYIDAKHGQTVRANASDGDCFYFYPQIGFTHGKTAAGLSLSYIEYTGNTWTISYNDQGHAGYSILPFNYGGFPGPGDGSVTLHMHYDEGLPKPKPITPELSMTTSKQIDYLGDGQPNPDTPNHYGANDYRLYLTGNTKDNTAYATYKPKNIIVAVDISLSMMYTFDGNKNGGGERFTSLKNAAQKLMEGLKKSDDRNKFSVVYFSSDDKYPWGAAKGSGISVNKGSFDQANNALWALDYSKYGGTDYYSAFRRIDDCCRDTPSDMENVVIFLTDGEPTSVPKEVLPRWMGALSQSVVAVPYTQDAAKKHLGKVSQFYSVFIGTNSGSAAVMNMVLRAITVPEKGFVQASNNSEMQKLIDKLTNKLKKPEVGVAMSDTLSKYVDLYTQPEYFKVTAKTTGSSEEPRVLNPGSDYEVNYDGASRTIRMKIKGRVTKDTTYTFSYDVRASSTALKEWKLSGDYPHVGDENTDYTLTHNTTSSGQPGFFSSEIDKAVGQITYDLGSGDQSADFKFPKPVVQVRDTNNSNGKIMGHVTLYNMELFAGKFTFELVDNSNNKPLALTTNDAKGDFSFDVNSIALTPGLHTYTLRQSTPPDMGADQIGGDHIKYDTHEVEVKVTVTDDPTTGLEKKVEYAKDSDQKAHFYNSFGIQGTYQ